MKRISYAIFFTLEYSESKGVRFLYMGDSSILFSKEEIKSFAEDPTSLISMIHQDDREEFLDKVREAVFSGKSFNDYIRVSRGEMTFLGEVILTARRSEDVETFLWDGVLRIVSATEKKENTHAYFRDFGMLVGEISTEFTRIGADQVDSAIDKTLEKICRYSEGDRAYVFIFNHSKDSVEHIYSWSSNKLESEDLPFLKDDFLKEYSNQVQALKNDELVYLNIPEGEKSFLGKRGIRSIILAPLVFSGETKGILGIDTLNDSDKWTLRDRLLFKLCGEIFANALVRKDKEMSLSRTRRLLEEVIKQSPVPMGILNPQGEIMMYNKVAADVLGVDYFSSQGIGLNYFDIDKPWFNHSSDGRILPVEKLPVSRILREGEVCSEEIRIIDAQGREHWLKVDGSPIYDEKGELIAGLTVFPEITQQKQTEQILQERIRELDCLYNISHLAEQEFISVEELLHGTVNIVLKSWKFENMSSVRIVFDDKVYIGDVSDSSFRDPHFCQRSNIVVYGEVKGYIGVSYDYQVNDEEKKGGVSRELNLLNDITSRLGRSIEKKQSEKALQESEARFRNYVESAPDGIFLADSYGLFVDVNKAACRMTGYSREELIGKPLSDLTYREDIDSTRESFVRVQREGRTTNKCRFVRKDGEVRYWTVDAVQVSDDSYLGFNRDITEQMKMEEQLRQMEKMDAIGQLAGGIAHDFNNQIGVIMGYSEMLVSQLKDPRLLKYAKNILAGAHRSDDLTRKLLAFAHKGLYETKAVNLHKIIGEAVDILSHSIDKKVSIKLSLKASSSFTKGDPTQIQNILINLALNARDAMPDGGTLLISSDNVSLDEQFCSGIPYEVNPGKFVRITVSDTGLGMDAELLSHIFEPFYTTKKAGKGTGMGLASVYGAMTNHKAVINVESAPGEGTSFFLYFFVEKQISREKIIHKTPLRTTEHAAILLVDDDELIRAMGTEILQGLGYDVTACSNGITALEFLRENHKKIDLVVLDMIMPGMGGKDVYRNIREISGTLPVLLSSGFSLSGEVQQLLDEGAAAFVRKPFELSNFALAVNNAIKHDEPPRQKGGSQFISC